jgi:flagellar motor switch protein FliN/FliY
MAEQPGSKGKDSNEALGLQTSGVAAQGTLNFISDVTLQVSVELGRNTVTIDRLLDLKKGSVLELEKLPEEPLDVRVNNNLVAQGEAVIVNDKFGVRVTQIISPEGELDTLGAI